MFKLFLVFLFIFNVVTEDIRLKYGIPNGYLSDCPGSSKEARIADKSLKHLQIAVLSHGNFLTTKRTIYNYHQMKKLAANTDFNKKIMLYVPGYYDHINFPISPIMGIAYKKLGYNVWILEYSHFMLQNYPVASRFLRPVGVKTGEMLAALTKYGLNPKKLSIVGISLGGQAISFIAKNYRRLTGMNISHITGLDPAGPCFRYLGPDERLAASDGDFVEVIHTNIDGFGMAEPMGHVDFYLNGGEFQTFDIPLIACYGLCSHVKTFFYWKSALEHPKCFIGMQCDTIQDARDWNCYKESPITNYMGEKVNKSRHGIFLVATTYYFPYCMNEEGLKIENNFNNSGLVVLNRDDVLIV